MNIPSIQSMEEAIEVLEASLHGVQEELERALAVRRVVRSIFENPQAAPEDDP